MQYYSPILGEYCKLTSAWVGYLGRYWPRYPISRYPICIKNFICNFVVFVLKRCLISQLCISLTNLLLFFISFYFQIQNILNNEKTFERLMNTNLGMFDLKQNLRQIYAQFWNTKVVYMHPVILARPYVNIKACHYILHSVLKKKSLSCVLARYILSLQEHLPKH